MTMQRPGRPGSTLTSLQLGHVRGVVDSAKETYGATLRQLSRNSKSQNALRHLQSRPVSAKAAVSAINSMLNSPAARAWRRKSYSSALAVRRSMPRDRPALLWRQILETLMPDRIERELAKSIKLLPEGAAYALASLAVRGLTKRGLISDSKRRRAETWLSATLSDLRLRTLPVIRFGIRRADGRLTGLPKPDWF
jgi:hypothetical protein